MALVTIAEIREAQARIAGVALHTPLLPLHHDAGVYLKPENFQPIGSFKIRGAYNRIAALRPDEYGDGVIAYSSGNHAQGVAFAAQRLGLPAVIVMPHNAPAVKIASTRAYGAQVVLYDPTQEKREDVAERLRQGKRYTLVPPFNDPYVIAGQGTLGAEIAADLPEVDLVLTPVGGAGLLSGVATAIKALAPHAKVIGVEPALAADAQASFRTGRIVEITAAEAGRTVADGVRTLAVGDLTFAQMRAFADDIIAVSEEEIYASMKELILDAKIVVEPTSAMTLAAWRFHRHELPAARRVVLVISGGSIDAAQLATLIAG